MSIYAEQGALTGPVREGIAELRAAHGDGTTDETTVRWRRSAACGLYAWAIRCDRTDGTVEVTVDAPFPYGLASVLLGALALGTAVSDLPAAAIVAVQYGCLIGAMYPLAPALPGTSVLRIPVPQHFELQTRSVTLFGIIPLAGAFTLQWLLVQAPLARAVSVGMYLLAGVVYVHRAEFVTAQGKRQFTVAALPAIGLVPALVSVGNLVVFTEFLPTLRPDLRPVAVGVVLVSTVSVLGLFGVVCRVGVATLGSVRLRPLDSPGLRALWAVFTVGFNGVFLLLLTAVLGSWLGLHSGAGWLADRTVVSTSVQPGGGPSGLVDTLKLVAVLLPLGYLAVLWVVHAASSLRTYLRLRVAARRVAASDLGFNPPVPVYEIDATAPFAHPVRFAFGLRPTVLVSSRVRNSLAPDELRAVCAHEAYHLRNRDPLVNAISWAVSLGFGGRNALLTLYDYPRVEREADRYAAETVGVAPLVRALRRMEQLTVETSDSGGLPTSGIGDRRLPLKEAQSIVAGPYELLFGGTLLDQSHESVDRRIEYITQEI